MGKMRKTRIICAPGNLIEPGRRSTASCPHRQVRSWKKGSPPKRNKICVKKSREHTCITTNDLEHVLDYLKIQLVGDIINECDIRSSFDLSIGGCM